MSENLKKYLKMQINLKRLTKEQVIEKYPQMKEYLEEEQQMDIADRERLVQVEDRAKSNTKRIDEHDNEIEN